MFTKVTATVKSSVLGYAPNHYLQEGRDLELVRGPLQGTHGIVLRKEKRHWLVIGIRLILGAAGVDVMPA
jgi:streptomycin 6-kinase